MNRSRLVSGIFTCAVAMLACGGSAKADDIELTLDLSGGAGTWTLSAEVLTSVGVDGSNGLAGFRAVLADIDFGSIVFAGGTGAIDPVDPGGPNERPAALDLTNGNVDLVYAQDLGQTGGRVVVPGVGVGSATLIASGTYSGAAPSFGLDDQGFGSEAVFLTNSTAPFTAAVDPDELVLTVIPDGGVLLGDVNLDTVVDALDIAPFVTLLSGGGFQAEADVNIDTVVDALDIAPFVALLSGGSSAVAVPEPTSMMLLLTGVLALGARRRS